VDRGPLKKKKVKKKETIPVLFRQFAFLFLGFGSCVLPFFLFLQHSQTPVNIAAPCMLDFDLGT
jgi:hypothetical protein